MGVNQKRQGCSHPAKDHMRTDEKSLASSAREAKKHRPQAGGGDKKICSPVSKMTAPTPYRAEHMKCPETNERRNARQSE